MLLVYILSSKDTYDYTLVGWYMIDVSTGGDGAGVAGAVLTSTRRLPGNPYCAVSGFRHIIWRCPGTSHRG